MNLTTFTMASCTEKRSYKMSFTKGGLGDGVTHVFEEKIENIELLNFIGNRLNI